MNIFDQNYLEDYYADESTSKHSDKLTDELKYALHIEKMFSLNSNFTCPIPEKYNSNSQSAVCLFQIISPIPAVSTE